MKGALYTTQSDGLRVTAILDNGMSLCMWAGAQLTSPHLQIWFDIDGPKKGQNMLGADVFGTQTNFLSIASLKGFTYMAGFSRDRDKIINTDRYGCSKDLENAEHYYDRYAGYYCGGLIQRNNRKIPDDYPVKF